MPLEEGPLGRVAVDVTLFDVDFVLLQKTSGVSAGRSSGLPEEDGLRHGSILGSTGAPWFFKVP
jgi:hypothetical protein